NTLTAELVYSPSRDANIRFLYTRSNIKTNNDRIGGATAEPLPYGIADDGQGGPIDNATADTIILNFDWLISKNFGIFGRYSYGSTNISPTNPAIAGGSVNVNAFQFGLGFPDLFKEGALGVLSFVVPYSYSSGRNFLVSGGGDGATQYDLELSYYYPVTKNIAIVPAFYAIFNPNSFSTNPTVFVGNLRTQFSF
ncbi:MAG: carbohydrate porin, partial [Pseudanabaena sp.]